MVSASTRPQRPAVCKFIFSPNENVTTYVVQEGIRKNKTRETTVRV
ncbi:hypothetical protein SOVF_125250 [Spinacia oleracea]|nr:hypothetical protein SOVF_125250 [Spinacia oleracea]